MNFPPFPNAKTPRKSFCYILTYNSALVNGFKEKNKLCLFIYAKIYAKKQAKNACFYPFFTCFLPVFRGIFTAFAAIFSLFQLKKAVIFAHFFRFHAPLHIVDKPLFKGFHVHHFHRHAKQHFCPVIGRKWGTGMR